MPKELEQLDTEELALLSESIENNAQKMSALLFPDCPAGTSSVMQKIGEWAVNRKVVLDSMAKGSPHIAVVFDKVCYRIWQQLPGYAQGIKIDVNPGEWIDEEHDRASTTTRSL
ncbi:MAG: hypothetical protein WAU91_23015 [Desulfatitalea sp.]